MMQENVTGANWLSGHQADLLLKNILRFPKINQRKDNYKILTI